MKELDWNLNYRVKIKLTDAGREILKRNRSNHGLSDRCLDEDEDGYCQFQMWEAMAIFGSECYSGNPAPAFEMECKILY